MGNPKSTLVDEAAAEEQPWLREALERLEAEEKDVSKVDEDLYDVRLAVNALFGAH